MVDLNAHYYFIIYINLSKVSAAFFEWTVSLDEMSVWWQMMRVTGEVQQRSKSKRFQIEGLEKSSMTGNITEEQWETVQLLSSLESGYIQN